MPMEINLSPIPNQSFTTTLDGVLYNMRIFLVQNIMCCDLSINGVVVLTSMRLVSGAPIIPYRYLINGNFIITTLNDELPNYEEFNSTQFLVYFTQAELEAIANGNSGT